jgi:hypothetical protein
MICNDGNADTKKVNDEYWTSSADQATLRNMKANSSRPTLLFI